MFRPRIGATVALIVLTIICFANGCSDDAAPRSSIAIESINNGQTLDCDVHNNGPDDLFGTSDDYVVEDQIPVQLSNHPHDAGLNLQANGPFGAVVFTRYEVRFEGDESLPPLFGTWYLRVETGTTVTGEITVVPASYKLAPPLSTLITGEEELIFTAKIKLIGVEEDSDDSIVIEVDLPVNAANWGDK